MLMFNNTLLNSVCACLVCLCSVCHFQSTDIDHTRKSCDRSWYVDQLPQAHGAASILPGKRHYVGTLLMTVWPQNAICNIQYTVLHM